MELERQVLDVGNLQMKTEFELRKQLKKLSEAQDQIEILEYSIETLKKKKIVQEELVANLNDSNLVLQTQLEDLNADLSRQTKKIEEME